MRDLIIIPNKSIGDIKLGASADDHNIEDACIDLEYNSDGEIIFIQIARYITDCNILINDIDVFKTKAVDLINKLSEIEVCKFDGHGFEYFIPNYNVSFWRSDNLNEDMIDEDFLSEVLPENLEYELENLYFETVSISVAGYYGDLNDSYIEWKGEYLSHPKFKEHDIKDDIKHESPTAEELNEIAKKYGLEK